MSKKTDNNTIWFIAIVALLIILILKFGDMNFNFTIGGVDSNTQQQLEGDSTGDCYISFSSTYVNVGDTVTGTIHDGANNDCYLYWRVDSGSWTAFAGNPLTTNENGIYTASTTATVAGLYNFRAVCATPLGEVVCITPLKQVTVVNPSGDGGSDGDDGSDGGDGIDGGIQYACNGVWNPTPSNCANAICTNTNERCIYHPDTIVARAYCGCGTLDNCNNLCLWTSNKAGDCRATVRWDGTPIRVPCGTDYHLSSADQYCPLEQFGNKACCCDTT